MLIYAGIDEAGYGPMLGPLCIGATVFRLNDGDRDAETPPQLWQMLRTAVCRKAGDRKRRVAVDDSKKLKGARDGAAHPLRHLERGVLSFCPHDAEPPATDGDLFELWRIPVPPRPWFDTSCPLPVAQTAAELRIARGRVQRSLERAGVRCEVMSCRAIDAEQFNEQVDRCGNKAAVNLRAAAGLLEAIWRRYPDDHPLVVVDRHGGRTRYAAELEQLLPGAAVVEMLETPAASRYVLERRGSRLTVTFAVDADAVYFPVALASMTAKYVRELFMGRLNRFFGEQVPELSPTAGYFGDARRYLVDIEPVIQRHQFARGQLVRRQ